MIAMPTHHRFLSLAFLNLNNAYQITNSYSSGFGVLLTTEIIFPTAAINIILTKMFVHTDQVDIQAKPNSIKFSVNSNFFLFCM
jgi:hypothetical protein